MAKKKLPKLSMEKLTINLIVWMKDKTVDEFLKWWENLIKERALSRKMRDNPKKAIEAALEWILQFSDKLQEKDDKTT